MALMKPNFYIAMIFVVLIFFTGMGIVGTSLAGSSRISLNEKSIDYINEVKGVSNNTGFDSIAETEAAETFDKGILDGEGNETVSDSNDFLSTLYIKKERASAPTNFFKLTYNIPSSVLIALSLPLQEFKHITNIVGYIFFISILSMIWIKYVNT